MMNKIQRVTIILLLLGGFLWSCKKDDPIPDPEPVQEDKVPVANNDYSKNNNPGDTITINLLSNDVLSDESDATPETVTVDIDLEQNGIQTELVVIEEGTWRYNPETGEITFYPVAGLPINPTPIDYEITDNETGLSFKAKVTVVYDVAPILTQKVNNFIKDAMEDVYLWYKELPDIDVRSEFDSEDYFYKLLYEDDKWSYITDDIDAFEGSLQGVETTYGYSLSFGMFSNSDNVYAIIEFVYPDSPADRAGLKRGDFIIQMNNGDITVDNYMDLLYSDNLTITKGILADGGLSLGDNVSLTAETLSLNPVLLKKVIEQDGHKIGYLFYAQYISDFNNYLDDAFQYFVDEQITDLVIDLRYNPGGYTSAAQHLCSSVAPLSVVNSNSTLVTFQWNDKYQQYWEENNITGQLRVNFMNNVPVKMGLNNVYILTGTGTASASELTITGLRPYMNVKTIGETTYGKYTASITLKPEDIYTNSQYYSDFDNWGIQPIVIRYANSEGVTDFKDGFVPDVPVVDSLWLGIPLGDKEDPLLKAAIHEITGSEVLATTKSARKELPGFNIFDRGFSKFDKNKRELIFDRWDKKLLEKNNL